MPSKYAFACRQKYAFCNRSVPAKKVSWFPERLIRILNLLVFIIVDILQWTLLPWDRCISCVLLCKILPWHVAASSNNIYFLAISVGQEPGSAYLGPVFRVLSQSCSLQAQWGMIHFQVHTHGCGPEASHSSCSWPLNRVVYNMALALPEQASEQSQREGACKTEVNFFII